MPAHIPAVFPRNLGKGDRGEARGRSNAARCYRPPSRCRPHCPRPLTRGRPPPTGTGDTGSSRRPPPARGPTRRRSGPLGCTSARGGTGTSSTGTDTLQTVQVRTRWPGVFEKEMIVVCA
ncbi:hypothetical protein AVEN_33006-1 [Araneus ventricosus]|uniref:Uncharacterized protein n=1 Tax=Araneus ventricosus TaxID=182803 RepID=A0A4Y2MY83_ARAVE|nr:hypothetical protein AVEN_33006-1 [Araneus ventricosus]